jgi:hypothetical protein
VSFGLGQIFVVGLSKNGNQLRAQLSGTFVAIWSDDYGGCVPTVYTDFAMRLMHMSFKLSVDELYLVLL